MKIMMQMAKSLENCNIVESEIKKLNDEIETLETERRAAMTDAMKISLGAQITAKIGLLTAKEQRLHSLEQQGKFHHIYFHCRFPTSQYNPLSNLFRHLLFTYAGPAITTQGKKEIGLLLMYVGDNNFSFVCQH